MDNKPVGYILDIYFNEYTQDSIRVESQFNEQLVYRQARQLCRVDVTDTARGILDLLRARNNELYLDGFSQKDVEILLNYFHTS